MENNKIIGKFGENEAVKLLRSKKYEILTVNFTCRFGEIDIIAQNKNYIVFIEVKTRCYKSTLASPLEFVVAAKQDRIEKTASIFLAANKIEKQPRFDVIEVFTKAQNGLTTLESINHIENAWE